jgi:hypothetical protein
MGSGRCLDLSMAAPTSGSTGTVQATASVQSSRTAPNSFTRSGRLSFRGGDGRCPPATPQKPLRTDEPVKQNGVLDPRRVTASGRRNREESRPPSVRGQLPSAASAQLVCTRSSGRIGGRGSIQVDRRNPGAGARANPTGRGRACAAARRAGLGVPQERRAVAVAPMPQLGVQLLAPGRSSRQGTVVMNLFLRGKGWSSAAQPCRNRLGSNGTCLRHRW